MMYLGVNYPAGGAERREDFRNGSEGWDFGPIDFTRPDGTHVTWNNHWRDHLPADLVQMWTNKISALRWFVLAQGKSFGVGSDAPRIKQTYPGPFTVAGLANTTAIEHWEFSIPSQPQCNEIVDDFLEMLELVRRSPTNVRIVPTLIDFRLLTMNNDGHAAQNAALTGVRDRPGGPLVGGSAVVNITRPRSEVINSMNTNLRALGAYGGLRWDAIRTEEARFRFLQRLVLPLITRTAERHLDDRILWWDIGNELDILWKDNRLQVATSNSSYAPYSATHPIFLFIRDAIKLIHGLSVTFGSETIQLPSEHREKYRTKTTVGWLSNGALRVSNVPATMTGEAVLQYHGYAHAHGQPKSYVVTDAQLTLLRHEDYVGRAPHFWRVPSCDNRAEGGFMAIRQREGRLRDCIIGEMATQLTLGRLGIDSHTDHPGTSEKWIAEFSSPLGSRIPDRLQLPSGAVLLSESIVSGSAGRTQSYLVYDAARDTLKEHLNIFESRGYRWAFLWEWNRPPAHASPFIEGDPFAKVPVQLLPSGQRIGYLEDIRGANVDICHDDENHQTNLPPEQRRP